MTSRVCPPQKRLMVWINLLGGTAVLASYVIGLRTPPGSSAALWGGVPQAILPLYNVSMLLATAGYFAYTAFLLFRVNPEEARVARRFTFGLFNLLYVLILVPSALWMPLTLRMLEQPAAGLGLAIRLVLAAVALGSLGLLGALLSLRPREPRWAYWLAVTGSVTFSIQTVLLDAIVWTTFFTI